MDQFEILKQSWKKQEAPESLDQLENKTLSGFAKHQRRVIFSNLCTSIGFAAAFVVIGWVWSAFPDRSFFFYTGIILVYLVMIVMLFIIWSGVQYKNLNSGISSSEYLKQVKKKLLFRKKTITVYTPIYSILLFLGLCCYYIDLAKGAKLSFILLMFAGTAAYSILVMLLTRKRSKRNVIRIDELIKDIDILESKLKSE